MATSSDFSTNNQYIKYRIIVDELSTSIPNNTSSVRVKVQVWRTNTGYTTYGSGTCYVTCNGNNASAGITSSQSFSYNSYTEVFNQTFTIPHNADGTKTIYVSSYISHDRFSSSSQGFNITLSTIPRASTVSSISGNTIGSNVVVNISRASSSFTHSVVLQFGNQTSTVSSATTSATFTPPLSWCRQVPTSASGTATVTVTTYNGSTSIGTSSTTFTLNVPSSVIPNTPSVTLSEAVTSISSLQIGAYVKSKSKVTGEISASSQYDATITGYKAEINGTTYTTQSFTTGLLSTSGTNSCKITVTDSRGRTNTYTQNFTVLDYTAPKINTFRVERNDSTPSNVSVQATGSITALNNKNTKTYTLKYKQQSASSYTSISLDNSTYTLSDSRTISSISEDHSYTFILEVKDYFGTTSSQVDIGTAFQMINWASSGTGMAIGGVYDTGIGGVLQINGATTIDGTLTADSFVGNLTGTATNATNVAITTNNPTNTTTNYVPFSGVTGNNGLKANDGFRYQHRNGTASLAGLAGIILGNNTKSGTAGNKQGVIRLFNVSSGYTDIKTQTTTNNITVEIPPITGTIPIKEAVGTVSNWQRCRFGSFNVYFKNGTITGTSFSGNGWGFLSDIALPVTFNTSKMSFASSVYSSDSAIRLNAGLNTTGTSVKINWNNVYGSSVTAPVYYNFVLIDFS